MSKPIIEVKGISKRYQLGSISAQTMRAELEAFFARFKKTKSPATSHSLHATAPTGASATSSNQPLATSHSLPNSVRSAEFWALRDVSFDVQPGEVVGIIGRNGAGKSTLLKILSRITEPTSGEIRVRGRIASLLEVGTGFHPELSGRENIFLNGAILGMSKAEISAKFDEIVDFAGVEQFIDTPVKRYSSGMYVRLAFAVAAHLEPEILIVDEVLAVGDAEFQKKCLGKIKDVSGQGRTVLFVSHNMAAMQRLCDKAILLANGSVLNFGSINEVISKYMASASLVNSSADLSKLPDNRRRGNGVARFHKIEIFGDDDQPKSEFREMETIQISFEIYSKQTINNVLFGFSIITSDGIEIMGSTAQDSKIRNTICAGINRFKCLFDPMVLSPGRYSIRAAIFDSAQSYDHIDELISFDVSAISKDTTLSPSGHRVGHFYLPLKWNDQNNEI